MYAYQLGGVRAVIRGCVTSSGHVLFLALFLREEKNVALGRMQTPEVFQVGGFA